MGSAIEAVRELISIAVWGSDYRGFGKRNTWDTDGDPERRKPVH